ncbi:MAG: hypothetical protein E7311_03385 [Clostridiales bacterium]|nr:hypothetical protein [Clostridiales bacterium]
MELINRNIFFSNDKIVENSKTKISYSGTLFQNGSEEVYIHYGYGLLWSDVNEIKMEKTELGYEAEIDIPSTDLFNCCFRDNNKNWDNNEGHNYSFVVEKNELVITKKADAPVAARRLRRSYILGKKLKLLFYKVVTYVPQILNGTYKRKVRGENIVSAPDIPTALG